MTYLYTNLVSINGNYKSTLQYVEVAPPCSNHRNILTFINRPDYYYYIILRVQKRQVIIIIIYKHAWCNSEFICIYLNGNFQEAALWGHILPYTWVKVARTLYERLFCTAIVHTPIIQTLDSDLPYTQYTHCTCWIPCTRLPQWDHACICTSQCTLNCKCVNFLATTVASLCHSDVTQSGVHACCLVQLRPCLRPWSDWLSQLR